MWWELCEDCELGIQTMRMLGSRVGAASRVVEPPSSLSSESPTEIAGLAFAHLDKTSLKCSSVSSDDPFA